MKPTYPKISIVTPSFNQGRFIEKTIQSVLSQDYPNLEYWVIDGGSTDNTLEILKKYSQHIHWVSKPDKGQTDAINKGLKKTTGEIVAYLNSDDMYLPNTLKTVGEFFLHHSQAQWVSGDYFIVDTNGKTMQSYITTYKKWLRSKPSLSTLSIANFISQPSTFWRRSVHKQLGWFDESLRYCMDFDFWMRLWTLSPPEIIPNHLALFRIHAQSKGGSEYRKQFSEEHQVMMRYIPNPLLQSLHWLHAQAIVASYTWLKKA